MRKLELADRLAKADAVLYKIVDDACRRDRWRDITGMSTVAMADEARKIIDRQQKEIDQLRAEHRRTLAALMDEKHRNAAVSPDPDPPMRWHGVYEGKRID